MKAENIELNHKFEVSKFLQTCISRGQASATQGMSDYGFERLHNELSELINQRVIEELEVMLSYFEEDGLYAIKGLKDRIKELKQE
jgi:hypothetical protein